MHLDHETGSFPGREEKIAELAHQLWMERGCPDGSPEEDWLEAERRITAQMIDAPKNDEEEPNQFIYSATV